MQEDEFKKEVDDLIGMINNFRLIQDKGQRKRMKADIRYLLTQILNKL